MSSTQLADGPQQQSLTLWVWPSGLYPRRIMFYLKAKALDGSITLSTLSTRLKIIPVSFDIATGILAALPNHEPRPPNTSLPVLRISHPNTDPSQDRYIYQSTSILNYLETVFPSHTQSPFSLLGNSSIHAAHVADIVSQINESLPWVMMYISHTNPMTLKWSGMTASEQSPSVAAYALKNWKAATSRLESWVKSDLEHGGMYVAGDGGVREIVDGTHSGPTIADFVLMATHDYVLNMYQWDCFEGCEQIQKWTERVRKGAIGSRDSVKERDQGSGAMGWYMSSNELERVEKEGFEILFGK